MGKEKWQKSVERWGRRSKWQRNGLKLLENERQARWRNGFNFQSLLIKIYL